MNFNLSQMPARLAKPRKEGLTMVMDKGLTLQEAKNFIENAVKYSFDIVSIEVFLKKINNISTVFSNISLIV